MSAKSPLYAHVVAIAREHLGPAGERFMRRQIRMHLKMKPEDLTQQDIPELLEWSRLAFAMLTDNQKYIDAFGADMAKLARPATEASRKQRKHAKSN